MAEVATDPIVALLLERLLPEIEGRLDAMVERKIAALAIPPPDPWLTTAEAARYVHLTAEALRARVRRGTIPAHRDGDRWLFHRDELDRHLLGHGGRDERYPAADNSINGPARLHPPGPWLQGGTP
jgi:excisionase family DNA binding protein